MNNTTKKEKCISDFESDRYDEKKQTKEILCFTKKDTMFCVNGN